MLPAMSSAAQQSAIAQRFRGFLPVVVDVETGGLDASGDALLELAAIIIDMDEDGNLHPGDLYASHVTPFEGANIDPKALEINGIDPDHPFRESVDEDTALRTVFQPVRRALRATGCVRAVLVGHNPYMDLNFVNAASQRCGIKRNPFHPFSCFDTATLGGLAYGQTVLARAVIAAGLPWNPDEAHSAVYDCRRTAQLFCEICNHWKRMQSQEEMIQQRGQNL